MTFNHMLHVLSWHQVALLTSMSCLLKQLTAVHVIVYRWQRLEVGPKLTIIKSTLDFFFVLYEIARKNLRFFNISTYYFC